MQFTLKKPCGNCPFKREGAIELRPGRVEGIKEHLLSKDTNFFQCHKSVHNGKTGGEWVEDDEGEQAYIPSEKEQVCVGSLIWQYKKGRLPIVARLAIAFGKLDLDTLRAGENAIID